MKPLFLLLVLLAALSGCSVYDRVFHPYRLPTPEAPPEFKRQMKAKDLVNKNRDKAAKAKKPKSGDPDAAASPDASPADDGGANATADTGTRQPATSKSTVKYDKGGLMKKPKLLRRRIRKPDKPGFNPIRSVKNFFKYKLHGKHKPKPKAAPADDAGSPAPEPDPNQAPEK